MDQDVGLAMSVNRRLNGGPTIVGSSNHGNRSIFYLRVYVLNLAVSKVGKEKTF